MHVLAAQSGVIGDTIEPIDLEQTPADIVVISAADSELSALARAHDGLADAPSLRLANFMVLSHNLSVDLYIEKTLRHAKLIILRLLGGASYWPYGLEQIAATAQTENIKIVVLPGDARDDDALIANSTVSEQDALRLWEYFKQGGPENMGNLLRTCANLIGAGEQASPPKPLLKAGLYWPGKSHPSFAELKDGWREGAPVAAITFYRALTEGGNTAPVDAMIEALGARDINALPIFVTSLKDEVSAAMVEELCGIAAPKIVLNATGFAVASVDGTSTCRTGPFSNVDCPVLQMVFAGSSRSAWDQGSQGLTARDLAMNVVLPELDGRILTRAVSFKSDVARHAATETNIVTYEPERDRIDFVAGLAANWIALARTPANERRVAVILANYPNRDGRIGNGVGYDTPASTVNLLKALQANGYRTDGFPQDGMALMHTLLDGPTNAPDKNTISSANLALQDYLAHFAALPEVMRQEVEDRWGPPEQDPFVRDGAFQLAVHQFGNVCVAVQPARGYNIDPAETYHDPALVPPHGYLAFHFWLREEFGAQAVLHNGKHGNLEWLPGKALALSAACYPEAALGPLPNIYPFIVNDPGEGTQAKRRTSAVIVDHLTPPLTRAETYGPLKDLEALIDEYYLAHGLDQRRLELLRKHILDLVRSNGLDQDSGISGTDDQDTALQKLDTYICELKETQIRDGLHVLGEAPTGNQETDLLVALTRVPRGLGQDGDSSLIRALAEDLGLG